MAISTVGQLYRAFSRNALELIVMLRFKNPHRSPLRYPGGKSRLVQTILTGIPPSTTTLCAPFIGGGAVELACAARGMRVMAYDTFQPLVNFWQTWIQQPVQLADSVRAYYPLTREQFYAFQQHYSTYQDTLQQAAIFFILNRASFSGTTFQGGMSLGHPRFTHAAIDRLVRGQMDHLWVKQANFNDSIPQHPQDFLYLDPPYYLAQSLYGQKGERQMHFDHAGLVNCLKQRGRWLLSYNDCAKVRQWYADCPMQTVPCQYSLQQSKRTQELLIFSPDLAAWVNKLADRERVNTPAAHAKIA